MEILKKVRKWRAEEKERLRVAATKRIHDFGVAHPKAFHVAESHGAYLLLAAVALDWSHLGVLVVCIWAFAVMSNIIDS